MARPAVIPNSDNRALQLISGADTTPPAKAFEHAPEFRIRPAGDWELFDVRETWRHRQVFWAFLWRNIARRHRQTVLGPLWFVIPPLMRMVIYSVALGRIAHLPSDGVPYPLFTFTGLLPWELFATGVSRSCESLVAYEHVISKVYFPRVIVPASEVIGTLLDFGMALLVLLAMALFYHVPLTPRLMAVPLFAMLAMVLSLALGLLVSGLHARYRDTSKILGYVIQAWFYGTPIAYSETVIAHKLPQSLMAIYHLNPMYQVVKGVRWAVLVRSSAPEWPAVMGAIAIVGVLLVIGTLVFTRTEHSIVDLI